MVHLPRVGAAGALVVGLAVAGLPVVLPRPGRAGARAASVAPDTFHRWMSG